jgi:hypothetical protein
MTKQEFVTICNKLAGAYPGKGFDDPNVQTMWYGYLQGFDTKQTNHIVNNWITTKTISPTISDIYMICRTVAELTP